MKANRKPRLPVHVFLDACREFFAELQTQLHADEQGAKAYWLQWSHAMQPIERMEFIMGGRTAAREITKTKQG